MSIIRAVGTFAFIRLKYTERATRHVLIFKNIGKKRDTYTITITLGMPFSLEWKMIKLEYASQILRETKYFYC